MHGEVYTSIVRVQLAVESIAPKGKSCILIIYNVEKI